MRLYDLLKTITDIQDVELFGASDASVRSQAESLVTVLSGDVLNESVVDIAAEFSVLKVWVDTK